MSAMVVITRSIICKSVQNMFQTSLKMYRRSEKSYKATVFDIPAVSDYSFDDHQPPPLEVLRALCHDAATWLEADPQNVVAIHCKAGKGRTGTAVAALLLYMHLVQDADEAIHLYGVKRTTDGKVAQKKRFLCILPPRPNLMTGL